MKKHILFAVLPLLLLADVACSGNLKYAEIVSPKYDKMRTYSKNFVAVRLGGKLGFIDKAGKEIVPFTYNEVSHFSGSLIEVKLGEKWSYIDTTGNLPKNGMAYDFSEGLARFTLSRKWSFIDKTGKEAVPH
jgi:hypothetical protein